MSFYPGRKCAFRISICAAIAFAVWKISGRFYNPGANIIRFATESDQLEMTGADRDLTSGSITVLLTPIRRYFNEQFQYGAYAAVIIHSPVTHRDT